MRLIESSSLPVASSHARTLKYERSYHRPFFRANLSSARVAVNGLAARPENGAGDGFL
jgi:hypothetical protein